MVGVNGVKTGVICGLSLVAFVDGAAMVFLVWYGVQSRCVSLAYVTTEADSLKPCAMENRRKVNTLLNGRS